MSSDENDTADELPRELVGIDPDDTEEVSYLGGVFKVGTIPSGVWARLNAARAIAHQNAQRRTIKRLAENGQDPDELIFTVAKDSFDATRAVVEASQDPIFKEEFLEIQAEAASFGARGHSKFVNRKGVPFPFATNKKLINGDTWEVLAPETMRVYRANVPLINMIWLALFKLNELGRLGKKD